MAPSLLLLGRIETQLRVLDRLVVLVLLADDLRRVELALTVPDDVAQLAGRVDLTVSHVSTESTDGLLHIFGRLARVDVELRGDGLADQRLLVNARFQDRLDLDDLVDVLSVESLGAVLVRAFVELGLD